MGLIFTKTCVLCGETLPADAGKSAMLCADCASLVRTKYRCTQPFSIDRADGAAAPLLYTGAVSGALKRFKFHHMQHYADWFAAQMAAQLSLHLEEWQPDLVTYIPIGPFRRYQRGYNQAELLAKPVAAAFSLPCAATLKKRLLTPKQSGRKDAAARRTNADRAFLPLGGAAVDGKNVLLVDDIVTTGSTAAAAVRLLREMGAARVYVLACAKTPLHGKGKA